MTIRNLAVVAALGLAACTPAPERIEPINAHVQAGLTCKDAGQALATARAALVELEYTQRELAKGDALSVAIWGFPISGKGGAENAAAVAVAKGHVAALETFNAGC